MSKEGAELRRLADNIDSLSLKTDAEQYGKIMDALKDKEDEFAKLAEETADHVANRTKVMEGGLAEAGAEVESTGTGMNSADVQYKWNGKTYNLSMSIHEVKESQE